MAKNLILGPILACLVQIWGPDFFSWVLLILDVRHCHKLSLYAISRKTYDPNLANGEKPHFGPDLGLLGPNSGRHNKIWLRQLLDIMVSYHHVKYQKKLMIQSWENLVTDGRTTDGRIDGRTDGQTDESDFTGRCPTDVERPKYNLITAILTFFGHFSYNQQLLKLRLLLINFNNIYLYLFAFFYVAIVNSIK